MGLSSASRQAAGTALALSPWTEFLKCLGNDFAVSVSLAYVSALMISVPSLWVPNYSLNNYTTHKERRTKYVPETHEVLNFIIDLVEIGQPKKQLPNGRMRVTKKVI